MDPEIKVWGPTDPPICIADLDAWTMWIAARDAPGPDFTLKQAQAAYDHIMAVMPPTPTRH